MTKDTQSSTHSIALDAPLPVRVPALGEPFDAVRVSVERFCLSPARRCGRMAWQG